MLERLDKELDEATKNDERPSFLILNHTSLRLLSQGKMYFTHYRGIKIVLAPNAFPGLDYFEFGYHITF